MGFAPSKYDVSVVISLVFLIARATGALVVLLLPRDEILSDEQMTSNAVRFAPVLCHWRLTSPVVLSLRDRLQMLRVTAVMYSAKMIHVQICWNWSYKLCVDVPMHVPVTAFDVTPSVAS